MGLNLREKWVLISTIDSWSDSEIVSERVLESDLIIDN